MNKDNSRKIQNLAKATLLVKTASEAGRFLRDLLTENELVEFGNRWEAASMLDQGISYSEISSRTGLSSTTIARISKWLNNGTGGYRLVLKRASAKTKTRKAFSHHGSSAFKKGPG